MKNPKRIALFSPTLAGGGAERMILNLAGELANRGIRVDLVVANDVGIFRQSIPENVYLINLQTTRVLFALPKLVRYLQEVRPISLLCVQSHANVVGILACKLARVQTRLIISEHSIFSIKIKNSPNKRERIIPFLARLLYPKADMIVAVSEGAAVDLIQTLKLGRNKVRVIHNPIVNPEIKKKSQVPISHPWFTSSANKVILAAGRLTRAKDYPTLLKAFALVRARRSVRLLILGEGEDRVLLEAQVRTLGLEGDVQMPGFVENPYAYMKHSDIFVLSSRWEGLSNVLVEAMACGTPVVSTNCPSGPAEILEDGQYGSLVPVGDASLLADAIMETLDCPVDSQVLQQRADAFSVSKITDQYLEVLMDT